MFDIFNSSGLHDVKLYKHALQEISPSFEYLYMMTDIFKRVKIKGSRVATPCITGWQLSISAVIVLWNDIKSVCGVKYLCRRKLNQYPLEHCFRFIRAKGGFCANPDTKQFADAYKQVLIKSCISQSELSDCESDTNSLLLLPLMMSWVPLNLQPLTSIRYPNKMLFFMLKDIVAKKYLAKHSCKECTSSLTGAELSDLSDSSTTFLQQKSYNSVSSAKFGLTIPSGPFVSFLKKLKSFFCPISWAQCIMSKVYQRLVNIILAGADPTSLPAGEWQDNFTVAVQFYVNMRVFYAVKLFNTSLAERPRNKRNRKTLILEHL